MQINLLSLRAVLGAQLAILFTTGSSQTIEDSLEPSAQISDLTLAPESTPFDITGHWVGRNSQGTLVSYLFEKDGSATIFEDGHPVLESGERSLVSWIFSNDSRSGNLDIVFQNDFGVRVETRFLAQFVDGDSILLRSGGPNQARPREVSEESDPMQIRLLRVER